MKEKITMIELFSGIGAQERALRQLDIPYEVIHTCDLDKDAILSYAAMRNDFEKEFNAYSFPSAEDMISELQAKNVGYDFMKGKHTITSRTPINKLKQYYLADKLSHNLGDISKLERLPYADITTYSFPCVDLSVAGRGNGMQNKCNSCGHSWPIDFSNANSTITCPNCGATVSSSTRSGLLGQVQRLLSVAYDNNELPKYLLLENVKNLVGKKFKPQFDAWISWLDSIGYNTRYKVLNAKHHGIAQNRERIFAISIRKDIDDGSFKFPEEIPLTTRLKDILEKNVDEKYYLPDDRIDQILDSTLMQKINQLRTSVETDSVAPHIVQKFGDRGTSQYSVRDYAHTIPANPMSDRGQMIVEPQVLRAERTEYGKAIRKQYEAGEVHEKIGNMRVLRPRTDGISNTITTLQKDNYVAEPQLVGGIGEKNFGKQYRQGNRVYDSNAIAMALNAQPVGNAGGYSYLYAVEEENKKYGIKVRNQATEFAGFDEVAGTLLARDYKGFGNQEMNAVLESNSTDTKWRIRKLTPKECWRLMGFTDGDHDRAAKYVSASALYKQAGNSICTCCLIAIFNSLFNNDSSTSYAEKLVDYSQS